MRIASPSHESSYSRDAFGGWIDADGDCYDTRAEVLLRSTTTRAGTHFCTVTDGRWDDPWSNAVTTVAHDLDIDHLVPLADAWRSGAWAWTAVQRRDYANDLTTADFLLAVPAHENRSKGDRGPDEWRPPQRSTWCRYAIAWDRVKAKWKLTATPEEWDALRSMAATC